MEFLTKAIGDVKLFVLRLNTVTGRVLTANP